MKINLTTTSRRYRIILADPPWPYRDLGHSRRVDRIYPIMQIEDIYAMRPMIDRLASPDCVLFLWATSPLLPEALQVMAAWGFKYKSSIVWDKQISGMGHYVRIRHEFLLLGIRGKPGIAAVHNLPSIICERRTKHSVKPAAAYEHIEKMYPNATKIELFARKQRDGWDCWRNEVSNPTEAEMADA